ncbi:membrane protein [gut metagenome]|uniref:Membrane protein n=1 Tax=gut metagenome TaxID=749906 RepID=J9DAB7_9ZZZZ
MFVGSPGGVEPVADGLLGVADEAERTALYQQVDQQGRVLAVVLAGQLGQLGQGVNAVDIEKFGVAQVNLDQFQAEALRDFQFAPTVDFLAQLAGAGGPTVVDIFPGLLFGGGGRLAAGGVCLRFFGFSGRARFRFLRCCHKVPNFFVQTICFNLFFAYICVVGRPAGRKNERGLFCPAKLCVNAWFPEGYVLSESSSGAKIEGRLVPSKCRGSFVQFLTEFDQD